MDWLLQIKQFLEQHPSVRFSIEVDPEGIDNDQRVYIISLEYNALGVRFRGPAAFDDIADGIDHFLRHASDTFGF